MFNTLISALLGAALSAGFDQAARRDFFSQARHSLTVSTICR